ncbi:MAG: 3-ketoacyl-ACP reductase [Clostridiales bacterium]|nr:3-ketoacyl-ACP reductase [Clostridiales bacterium]
MSAQRVAVVTGSRRGIGLGIALALGRAGYRVVVSGTSQEGDQALAQFGKEGLTATYVRCDVSSDADRRALIAEIIQRYGRLDVLVNNAGVAPTTRMDVLDTTEESFDRVLDINLKGTFFLCQLAAREMIAGLDANPKDYCPRIVNIGSISAYTVSLNRGEYCISKAGVGMVTQLFATRLARHGIPVFEVRPGIVRTDMTAPVAQRYEEQIAEGLTPVPRMGEPEDIAGCVLAAVSGQLDFATGTVLNGDGGFHIRRL